MRDFGPLSDQIVPIQIRPDLVVNIFGIPHDLTPAEAAKVAGVITALANSPSGRTPGGHIE